MNSFSVASLTSLGTNIAHRAVSSAEELNELIGGLDSRSQPIARLSTFASQLPQLHEHVAQLEAALDASSVISPRLQTDLSQYLTSCDGAMAALNKQVMRLQPGNVERLDQTFLVVHAHSVYAYCQLFSFFVKILSVKEKEGQDALLNTNEGRSCLQHVNDASQKASQAREILLQEGQNASISSSSKGPLPGSDVEPPPYESMSPSSPTQGAGESSGSNFAKSMSSLTNSFKAMTSNLWAKPDPLATAFCEAARRGDVRQMEGFLVQGANINGRNAEGQTPLSSSVLSNKEEAARFLLDSGADITARDASKMPPLFLACSVGSIEVAQLLLNKGADVTQTSWSGQPYFFDVVISGNLKGTQFLLVNGASASATSRSGRPIISYAVKNGNVELVRLLLQYGADANAYDLNGNSMIAVATSNNNVELARLLLQHGAKSGARNNTGNPVLADALFNRRMEIVRLLLEHGADAGARDIYAQPLLVATVKDTKLPLADKIETARLLLQYGASANVSDGSWNTHVLCHAMEIGSTALVTLLLDHGSSTDKKMKDGETLLLYAIDKGRLDQARALVEHGADANATDKKGRTPLTQALASGDVDLIKLLKRHGADVNKSGAVSPAEMAAAAGNPEIFRALGLQVMPPTPRSGQASRASSRGTRPARPPSPPPGYEKVTSGL